METNIQINTIGKVVAENYNFSIQLDEKYIPALKNINGYSHLQIIWWGNLYDDPEYRENLICEKPYKTGPDKIGIFGTRSPVRPNPILITTIFAQEIDFEKGIIYTPYIDAENGTPVLDIKPYHLSERVTECHVPDWCKHWPGSYEESAVFDWQNEFNF